MPTTTKGLRYPAESDTADVPRDMQNLASDVDTKFLGYAPTDVPINSAAKLVWGGDTNLYRSAADTLASDDALVINNVGGVTAISAGLNDYLARSRVTGDTTNRLEILRNGYINWGPGGTTAVDCNLYRQQAGGLQSDAWICSKGAAAGTAAFLVKIATDTNWRWYIQAGGTMTWGDGTNFDSTNLYRSGANTLKTDGYFYVNQGIAANQGTSNQILLWSNGQLMFGSASDIWLARLNSSTLGSNGTWLCSQGGGAQMVFGNYSGNAVATIQFGSSADCGFHRAGTNSMNCWGTTWETMNAAAFAVQSDRETKTEIEKVDAITAQPHVDTLLAAGIYRYERDDTGEKHIGLMSDELPAEVVTTAYPQDGVLDGAEHQMVDLYKLVTTLVATVQHLNERLTAVEAA